ncbi:hypothetical protein [Sorangium cellulosum]|uniref:Uncharacterized protein n=1 Tax=Sorangium cellulosum So0157-2 TaxID=1254432 RepID=S4Y1T8_SORCE|nr:hypothetical protein [Sorangium cellulosum]AGP36863.1 hypothetical protein SCE1572_21600 [Sorangium cellulosum So0157-2]
MQASRWFVVWMAVGAFGMAGTAVGCSDTGDNTSASPTSTTTGSGGAGGTGSGGAGGTGSGGAGGTGSGGAGGTGSGGAGGTGSGGAGGTGSGGAGGTGSGGAGGTGSGGAGGTGSGGAGGTGSGGSGTGGAGGAVDQHFTLSVYGAGYVPAYDAGTTVYVDVVAVDETEAILSASDTIAANGTFSVTGQLLGGKAYTMHWYVDLDTNGICRNEDDHVWTQDIPVVTADVKRDVGPSTAFGTCP